jgi:hypothetical protein
MRRGNHTTALERMQTNAISDLVMACYLAWVGVVDPFILALRY